MGKLYNFDEFKVSVVIIRKLWYVAEKRSIRSKTSHEKILKSSSYVINIVIYNRSNSYPQALNNNSIVW